MNQRGSIHLPMMTALVLITLFGFGCWGLLRIWRGTVATQLKLDTCVAKASIEFQDRMKSINGLNRAIQITRGAIVAAVLSPEAIPPLKTALTGLITVQDLELLKWKAFQANWLLIRTCGKGSLPIPLPGMKWDRLPPDPVGEQSLIWRGLISEKFHFEVTHGSRAAAANAVMEANEQIVLEWALPFSQSPVRASLD